MQIFPCCLPDLIHHFHNTFPVMSCIADYLWIGTNDLPTTPESCELPGTGKALAYILFLNFYTHLSDAQLDACGAQIKEFQAYLRGKVEAARKAVADPRSRTGSGI